MSEPAVDLACILLETPFHQWHEPHSKDLLEQECPTPYLGDLSHFREIWYRQYSWLCGSQYVRRLFCWPCLLFDVEKTEWNLSGFDDFVNGDKALAAHGVSVHHVGWVEYLKNMTRHFKGPIAQTKVHAAQHNETVRLNRQIVLIAVESVLFLHKIKDSEFREDFENFYQLFNVMISKSPRDIQLQHIRLREILTRERMNSLRTEVTDCIVDQLLCQIREELTSLTCFGVQMDDITDIMQTSACVITIRYMTEAGQILEWFLGIHRILPDRGFRDIMAILDDTLEGTEYEAKLVSLAIDSLVLKREELQAFEALLADKAPLAVVTYTHPLSKLLQECCFKQIKACRVFFSTIHRIPEYFRNAPLRDYLDAIPLVRQFRTELNAEYEWWYHSRLLVAINDWWNELKAAFEMILLDSEVNETSIYNSKCFLDDLNDFDFAFLSVVFKTIFQVTDKLNYTIQCKSLDLGPSLDEIRGELEGIDSLKANDKFLPIFQAANDKAAFWKRNRNFQVSELFPKYKSLLNQIVDTIMVELTVRLQNLEKLSFFSLADSQKFQSYTDKFPTEEVEKMIELYPTLFVETQDLTNELSIFYTDQQFWNMPLYNLTRHMFENNLHNGIYKETHKMFRLILTVHSSSTFGLSTKKLQDLRSSRGTPTTMDNLSSFACMTMNKDMLNQFLTGKPYFYEDIVDRFYNYTNNDKDLFLLFRE